MDATEQWNDLGNRLDQAAANLNTLAHDTMDERERKRLLAKAEGVMLALDYMRGYGPVEPVVVDIDTILGATTPELFDLAGGFDYTDSIAEGLSQRWRKQASGPVIVSVIDLAWLLDGYARARQGGN